MTQRTALFLAAVLTVCVLVLGAGTVLTFAGNRTANAASVPAATATATSAPQAAADPAAAQLLKQRDAQYRAEIEKANTQLRQAYQTIQTLQAQNQELQQREVVYQQRLGEAIQYIQFIQNQLLQSGGGSNANAFAGEGNDDHD